MMMIMMIKTVTFNAISKYMVSDRGLILPENRRGPRALNLTIIIESHRIQTA